MAFSKFATAVTEARSSSRAAQIGSLSYGLIELLRVKKLYDGVLKRVNVVRAWVLVQFKLASLLISTAALARWKGDLLAVISRFDKDRILAFMNLFGHYDCGGTHKNPDRRNRLPPTASVAGYLATASQWYEHDRLWRKRLKRDGFVQFHMTDFMANSNGFEKCKRWSEDRKNAFLNDLISITANNVTFGIGMAVHRADYDRVFSEGPETVHRILGSPYAFCAFRCFESGVDWSVKAHSPEPINYVFERGDQHWEQINDTHSFLCSSYWLGRRYWLGSLTFDPKRNTSLQAADLLTWELNREFYRQHYPEPEYAYSRPTLVALMERISGDYRGYHEDDLRGYLQDVMDAKKLGKKRKEFIINVPLEMAQPILDAAKSKSHETKNRVPKVRRNNLRTVSRSARGATAKAGKRRARKSAKKKAG